MALFPIHAIVRRFFGNDDVVHMAFAESCDRLADERRILLELGNRLASAIAHPGLEPSDELVDDRRQGSLVRHASFDAFRHEVLGRAAALALPGIEFQDVPTRAYTGTVGAHLYGYVGEVSETQLTRAEYKEIGAGA